MSLPTVSQDVPATTPTGQSVVNHHGIRQFVKFAIVGASSTVVNFAFVNVLTHVAKMPLLSSLSIAFVVSVINGFYWNRNWTFKHARSKSAYEQSLKFVAVNCVGWMLNTTIVVLIVAHANNGGHGLFGDSAHIEAIISAVVTGQGKKEFGFWLINGALTVATGVIVFWNFFANRLWTFKHCEFQFLGGS